MKTANEKQCYVKASGFPQYITARVYCLKVLKLSSQSLYICKCLESVVGYWSITWSFCADNVMFCGKI